MSLELYNTTRRDIPEQKLMQVIEGVLGSEGLVIDDLTAVYCGNRLSRRINCEFLQHDYPTDTITFRYNDGEAVEGELYISLDIVAENAQRFNVSFTDELFRVTIHSALHLAGFEDTSVEERASMKEKEDHYLNCFCREDSL